MTKGENGSWFQIQERLALERKAAQSAFTKLASVNPTSREADSTQREKELSQAAGAVQPQNCFSQEAVSLSLEVGERGCV